MKASVSSGWYYSGWSYRKEHNLTSSSAVTDYQIRFDVYNVTGTDSGNSVYLGSNVQADFDDVRWTWYNTSSNSEVECDYWIESYSSDHASFWVEVPSIPSSGNSTIYIYYGNSTATTTSNGDNTFVYFDDFEGDSLGADWNSQGTISVSNSEVSLDADDSIYSSTTFGVNHVVRTKAKADEQDIDLLGFRSSFNITGKDEAFAVIQNSDYDYPNDFDRFRLITNDGTGTHTDTYKDGLSDFRNTYHIYEVRRNGTTSVLGYQDDTLIAEHTDDVPTGTLGVGWRVWDSSQASTLTVDWVLVRKYVSPEPAHGSWGTEEEETQEYSHTFTETLSHSTTLKQLQEQLRIWIETVYPSTTTMSLWREVSYTYTQTVTTTETVTYLQEHIRVMQESLSPTETMEHAGESLFTFTQTITPSETVTYLQEQQYTLTEKAAPTTIFSIAKELVETFITNIETVHAQAVLYKQIFTPAEEVNTALVLAAFAAAIAIVALSLTITKKD